ncbi:MAG: bifunctional 5,10-methylenetetrahydrofolate dehydrogenase/5,10-methenyltetrahydrofolate cyclohydrolase [Lachnospiraceae bacterium]|nr:bifunctional 5,10-methylenetetrahydrofolate dehydrogenase/5,10-methenyltetrahydrofolate cyclohydrolase [Lachnospiraceae bacterium]
MKTLLSGKETSAGLLAELRAKAEALPEAPALSIIRVGEKKSDIAYEKGVRKKAEQAGVSVFTHVLPEDVTEEILIDTIHRENENTEVDGILLFLPLPAGMDEKRIINEIAPEKDMDGATRASMLGIYTGSGEGYAPCTPEAVMRILEYYNVDLTGKNVVIVGRSLVVGKPLSMMMLKKNATVTICHTKTENLSEITKKADIIVAAAGHIGTITGEHVTEGQIVIDVGINFSESGKMTGDVVFDETAEIVDAITPVPGGVGAVTSSVMLAHVLQHAGKRMKGAV